MLDEVDGLLKQGCSRQIENMHRSMPKITPEGRRLQMVVCSATLHDFEVKKLSVSTFLVKFMYSKYLTCTNLFHEVEFQCIYVFIIKMSICSKNWKLTKSSFLSSY